MKNNLLAFGLLTILTLPTASACPDFSGNYQEYSPQFKTFLPTTLKISQSDCSQITIQSGKQAPNTSALNGIKKINNYDNGKVELSALKIVDSGLFIHSETHFDQNPNSSHFTELEAEFFLDSGNNLIIESKSRETELFFTNDWKQQTRQFFKRL